MLYLSSRNSPIGGRFKYFLTQMIKYRSIHAPISHYSTLKEFTDQLDLISPRFKIHGSNIKIISSPSDFYETLKTKFLAAENRIFISTLYIGIREHELISTLYESIRAKSCLKVSILTDALRGTRESPSSSCASLLAPLVEEFGPERVDIRMYHTPNLTGVKKYCIPKRINEGWGLQHIKLYGFDDEIIVSGANLSSEYFTNRQDRYHLFSSKGLTDYFFRLHTTLLKLSFQILPNSHSTDKYTLEWPISNLAPSPLISPLEYISESSKLLSQDSLSNSDQMISNESNLSDTVVYPIVQLTPLSSTNDPSTELSAIKSILSTLISPRYNKTSWTFTAGYFNPIPELTQLLLSTASTSNTIITASPWANGFYGSKGVSRLIPCAYTLLLRHFLEAVEKKNRERDISVKEWRLGTVGEPNGWTYHAKGLWISLEKKHTKKSSVDISIIGSSNYTKRSYSLDLEAGVIIFTENKDLKMQLGQERDNIEKFAKEVSLSQLARAERKVGLKVRLAMWIVSMLGCAL
ncbi:CDP-diacylglycerol--glycerol-3-phosphate 3-phosphatidyltransferase [Golovinomyces cichoracearum]|uniref:CDP-diacylglycerol--glycerol-3-phosphate 3-phosphatidyltransferase n=1 Tax=Golovinomyces cichoracearum TaxID=62708 RepID=A0A420IK45_9PEZI|nr:CDP-diacylglycerol--glycerol-3-phosphate 3-phosphatidyltransferase [Golovinomyces cichoracearum]